MDLNFFGPLKNILGKIIRHKVTSNETLQLGKEEFAEILMSAWERIQPSWLKRGFALSGIHTTNSIDKNAITEEELYKSLPYDKNGAMFLQLTEQ